MALGQKILGFLSGGFAEKGADLISKVIKDKDQAEQLAADFRTLCQTQEHELHVMTVQAEAEAERLFHERTVAMEGTAKDLQAVPYIGAVVIFLRGAFRPGFAYLTAYFDWLYFVSGMAWTERQETLLLSINLLVLIFFFGERALKNVMPLITQVFVNKAE